MQNGHRPETPCLNINAVEEIPRRFFRLFFPEGAASWLCKSPVGRLLAPEVSGRARGPAARRLERRTLSGASAKRRERRPCAGGFSGATRRFRPRATFRSATFAVRRCSHDQVRGFGLLPRVRARKARVSARLGDGRSQDRKSFCIFSQRPFDDGEFMRRHSSGGGSSRRVAEAESGLCRRNAEG